MGKFSYFKKIIKLILVLTLSVSILVCYSFDSFADQRQDQIAAMQQREEETQATISDLEKQTKETREAIASLQGQKNETEQNVNNLQHQSSALQSTIDAYSTQLDDLSTEIAETEAVLAEVSAEIVDLNNQLAEAQEEEAIQYDLLKKQIKLTYESGGSSGMLMMLFTCGSIQDFLTKSEYLSAVVSYDRRKIREFQELQAEIEEKKAAVEARQAELDAYQEQLDEKHEELADLTDEVKGQLNTTNSNINSEKGKLAGYNQQLEDLDKKMKSLESQTAAAQAALAQQIAERLALMKEDTGGSYAASATEVEWLAATIQAEADGESYTGKLAVGSVIMNRVKSSNFPNTVVGVITQSMQFASYRSGKVELIIGNGPNSTCIQAAKEVINGARVGDYLFFMTKYYADYYGIAEYTMIGNHAFFYSWKTKAPDPNPEPEPEPEPAPDPEPEPEPETETESDDESDEESEGNSEDNSEENSE